MGDATAEPAVPALSGALGGAAPRDGALRAQSASARGGVPATPLLPQKEQREGNRENCWNDGDL